MTEYFNNEESLTPVRNQLLRDLFSNLPDEYGSCYRQLADLRHAFHKQLADFLQPRIQAELQALPHETAEDKKMLASWVNGQLHQLGLAVEASTGQPAILVIDQRGGPGSSSRFRFDVLGETGPRKRRGSSERLPELKLTEAPPPKRSFAKWTERSDREPSTWCR